LWKIYSVPCDSALNSFTVIDYRVEAGSKTSTQTLRGVGGDEKGCLKPERVKYGLGSQGTATQAWLQCRGPTAIVNDTVVLSSERAAPNQQTSNCLTVINGVRFSKSCKSEAMKIRLHVSCTYIETATVTVLKSIARTR
jgi:hypothetical protein